MPLNKTTTPTKPPLLRGVEDFNALNRHLDDVYLFLQNTPNKATGSVANATSTADVVTKFNNLLALLRSSGVIKP